ncbi:hypothetical protein G7Y89_g7759 [Cudoniella acicularis]|uniref:SUR7 protein n=1 Tax=Cudoniella acicularis TaxID=354080 RepID=A0A8H4W485_9HELO|nr:hypothetical protein G7Y89_g7759 [Cudoniella acicularis]
MGVGRFICVALPFILTGASLVAMMVAMLAGVTDKSLDMFDVQTKDLSISSSDLLGIEKLVTRFNPNLDTLTTQAIAPNAVNITASTLELADSYKVSLWAYCRTTGTNTTCTKAKFNWAASAANTTQIEQLARTAINYNNVTIPKDITDALNTFIAVNRWTEVVYIIAIILTVLEIVVGLTGFCSRIGSCFTYILSGLSSTAIFAASTMATAESAIAVGSIKATAKAYGMDASLNTRFLATTWLATAFSLAAGFFWLFTVCCCAAEHKQRTRRVRGGDAEKLIPVGAYQRVDDPHHHNQGHAGGYNVPMQNVRPQQRGHGGAYEPYSHTAI